MREMRAARSGKRTAKPGAPFFLVPACPPPATPLPSFSSPIVGMVVTISPSFSLYRMVVLPAASSPTWGGKGEGVGAREGKREQKKKRSMRGGRARRGATFFSAPARPAARPAPFIRPAQPTGMTRTPPMGREARDEVGGAQGVRDARRRGALTLPPPPAQGKRPPPPPGHAPAPALPPRQPSPSAAHHQDPHFLLGEQPRKQLGEGEPHFLVFLGASDRRKKQKKGGRKACVERGKARANTRAAGGGEE